MGTGRKGDDIGVDIRYSELAGMRNERRKPTHSRYMATPVEKMDQSEFFLKVWGDSEDW